jgi:hypothetical protein
MTFHSCRSNHAIFGPADRLTGPDGAGTYASNLL